MSEDLELTPGGAGLDRRDFIRRSAIVGGMVWAAPMIQSLGSPAFAFGTPDEGENGDMKTISYIAFALVNQNEFDTWKFEDDGQGTSPADLDQSPTGCQLLFDENNLDEGTGGNANMLLGVDRTDPFTWIIKPASGYGVKWVLVKGGANSGGEGSSCTYIDAAPVVKEDGTGNGEFSVSTAATTA